MLIELEPIPFLSHAEQIARRKQIRMGWMIAAIRRAPRLPTPSHFCNVSALKNPFPQQCHATESPPPAFPKPETTKTGQSPDPEAQDPPEAPIPRLEKARQLASRIPRPLTTRAILRIVATLYDLDVETITSSSRKRQITRPRQIVCYLAKHFTKTSLPGIGRRIGGRDHTTMLHSVRRIASLLATDAAIASQVQQLHNILAPAQSLPTPEPPTTDPPAMPPAQDESQQ